MSEANDSRKVTGGTAFTANMTDDKWVELVID